MVLDKNWESHNKFLTIIDTKGHHLHVMIFSDMLDCGDIIRVFLLDHLQCIGSDPTQDSWEERERLANSPYSGFLLQIEIP